MSTDNRTHHQPRQDGRGRDLQQPRRGAAELPAFGRAARPLQWQDMGSVQAAAQDLVAQIVPQLAEALAAGRKLDSLQLGDVVSAPAPRRPSLKQWDNPGWLADLDTFFKLYGKAGAKDAKRQCSNRTVALRREVLVATFKELARRVRGLRALSQFSPRYIPEIIAIWSEVKQDGRPRQTPSTQVANFSVLRWFWGVHGIKTEPISHYVEDPLLRTQYRRESVASTDKSWSGNGIDVDEVIALAAAEDPVLERLLIMAKEFGLRANEGLSMNPNESDGGDHLRVLHGAKGGRRRVVRFEPFGDDSLRRALEELQAKNPAGVKGWEGLSLDQARKRLYYLLRKIGVTRKAMGVTLHGLRAQFAIDKFEQLSGSTAPVRGGAGINYRHLDDVRLKISQAMGHNRIRVTSAYYGSFDKMAKVARARFLGAWEKLQSGLPEIQRAVVELGLTNLWLVGSLARGEPAQQPRFEFLIDRPDSLRLKQEGRAGEAYERIAAAAEPLMDQPPIVQLLLSTKGAKEIAEGAVPLLVPIPPCVDDERPAAEGDDKPAPDA